jgi:valyl-tRNA synthetase
MTALSTPSSSSSMTAELPKSYTPAEWEEKIRARWEETRAFHADPIKTQAAKLQPFCIVIPPPNVTAALHLGHAFNNTLQDILIRYHRMKNGAAATLWMPGTDHAGIATQAVVEKRLLLQNIKRRDLGREKFVEKVQAWKDEYEATILEQLKSMGCSCDFERTRFTMDEVCAKAVREVFFRLFKDGLIYRGKRLVNWDPASQTALADDEVEMEEVQGHMYYLRYPLVEPSPSGRGQGEGAHKPRDASGSGTPSPPTPLPQGEGSYVTVATTRPETMLGDVAVAMNPKDPRAPHFVGKHVRLPIVDRIIPIIADDYVVRPAEFGGDENDAKAKIATGFLKVTPAHDDNDYAIGQRHNLPMVNVFAPDASISDKHGWTDVSEDSKQFLGLSREEARKKIVEWFKSHGLLEDVKPYTHSVGHSYRSHVPIEPYLSDQWYVAVTDDRLRGEALRAMAADQIAPGLPGMDSLPQKGADNRTSTPGKPGAKCDHNGGLRFYPARYAKTFQSWHENIRDWCISRQLWWGHRIPVFAFYTYETQNSSHEDAVAATERLLQPWISQNHLEAEVAWAVPTDESGNVSFFLCAKTDRAMGLLRDLERAVNLKKPESSGDEIGRELAASLDAIEQDSDVLDTWFSSALWPISTMGWPEPEAFPEEIPEGSALLNTFNPSSVLCTAREIITLWVSRMVMFNRYFRDGLLPFEHVYVHAMIQDGHGQKMSKSLGNGVDPRDIIHSHGSDALRFTLAKLATSTQDVRLPVDMICPFEDCGETFQPKEITTSSGYRVADAIQTCPKCKRKMVSGYGAATGIATPTQDMPLARNSSRKFDDGRNFANKIWNATRFALANLATSADKAHGLPSVGVKELPLVDRWIISRLHRALHAVEDALNEYQFNAYCDAMYDFVWRDFCDWYLEAIKPTIKSSPQQQQVLRTVLNAIMRLLHPIMPFVTETLWTHVNACGFAGLNDVRLEPSDLLAIAEWPDIKCSVDDDAAIATFERIQNLVNAIRNLRSERQVPPKKKIRLAASAKIVALIHQAAGVVENLALLDRVETLDDAAARPAGAIPLAFEGEEVLLSGLVDELDIGAEKARLTKVIGEKEKAATGFRSKLSNEGYLSKAPPERVAETRQLLAQAEADLEAARNAIQSLG